MVVELQSPGARAWISDFEGDGQMTQMAGKGAVKIEHTSSSYEN